MESQKASELALEREDQTTPSEGFSDSLGSDSASPTGAVGSTSQSMGVGHVLGSAKWHAPQSFSPCC